MANDTYTLLDDYNLLLIKYTDEIWLKSTKVKMRMINILIDNIKGMLNKVNLHYHKYQLSKDATRLFFFFKNKDLPKAIELISQAFGVYSVSPAIRTSNRMKNIIERTLEVGEKILNKNDTFALRVKRSGNHDFSSQDVARKAGKAVLDHFPNLNLQVNLGDPDKIIFIEVRGDFSYIFTDIVISKWKGLPIKERRKVLVMDNGRIYDLLAGMLLMRRGCKIYPIFFTLTNDAQEWEKRIANWQNVLSFTPFSEIHGLLIDLTGIMDELKKEMGEKDYLCALCRLIRFKVIEALLEREASKLREYQALTDGLTYNNLSFCPDEIDLCSMVLCKPLLFTPLIGFSVQKIETYLSYISKNLRHIEYCIYTPRNQKLDSGALEELYQSLNADILIEHAIDNKKNIIIH